MYCNILQTMYFHQNEFGSFDNLRSNDVALMQPTTRTIRSIHLDVIHAHLIPIHYWTVCYI